MKNKKKKVILLFAILFVVVILAVSLAPKQVLKGWSGTYSESKHKQTIQRYRLWCKPISVEKDDENPEVRFKTSFVPKEGKVVRVAKVDEKKGRYYELNNYYDMLVGVNVDGREVIVTIGNNTDMREHKLWSYLICITDEGGQTYYYYCRVSYI